MEHIGFVVKNTIKYCLIHDGGYKVALPGGKKVRVTPAALRKAAFHIRPSETATIKGLELVLAAMRNG